MRKIPVKILLYILVAIVVVLYAYPLLFTLSTALKTQDEFRKDVTGFFTSFHLDNFPYVWTKAKMGDYFWNSVLYVTVCTGMSMLFSIFVSYPISRNYVKFAGLITTAFIIGMFLPDAAIPKWKMFFNLGLYNTRIGYMMTMIGTGGVGFLMYVAYIKSIPKDLDEAAMIDGCEYFHFIFRILVPLMKPVLVSMGLLGAIGVWNEAINAIIYMSNDDYYPITRGLYVFKGQYGNNWPELSAALCVVAFPMIIVYVIFQKHIVDGIVAGGIKM